MELVKCETVDLEVPATSEIVIEGYVSPKEVAWEGPFGEYTGYRASPRDQRPVFKVTAITHRDNPILTFSCMGVPLDESDVCINPIIGARALDQLRKSGIPVVDLCCYPRCSEFIMAVSVKKTFNYIAQRVASCIWGMEGVVGQVTYVIVLDDDVDPNNIWQVLHALGTKCHPYRGIHRMERTVGWSLAPWASREERLTCIGAKAYFDCTWPMEWDPSIAVPPRASFDKIYSKEVQEHVLRNWKSYGYKKG